MHRDHGALPIRLPKKATRAKCTVTTVHFRSGCQSCSLIVRRLRSQSYRSFERDCISGANLRISRPQSNGPGQGGKSALRANNHVRPGCLCCHCNGCAHATRQFAEKSRACDARKGEDSSPRKATNQAVRRPHPHRGGGGMTAAACLRGTTCHCAETDQCACGHGRCAGRSRI